MKLTKYMRDAFVRAAINDVPQIDYAEQIRKEAMRACVAAMPPAVRDAYRLAPERFKTSWAHIGSVSVTLPVVEVTYHKPVPKFTPPIASADTKLLADLVQKLDAQNDLVADLRSKLSGAASSVTTRKALAALLPEFEKYLPADDQAAVRTLPAVANVVADFTRAGWPAKASGNIRAVTGGAS